MYVVEVSLNGANPELDFVLIPKVESYGGSLVNKTSIDQHRRVIEYQFSTRENAKAFEKECNKIGELVAKIRNF